MSIRCSSEVEGGMGGPQLGTSLPGASHSPLSSGLNLRGAMLSAGVIRILLVKDAKDGSPDRLSLKWLPHQNQHTTRCANNQPRGGGGAGGTGRRDRSRDAAESSSGRRERIKSPFWISRMLHSFSLVLQIIEGLVPIHDRQRISDNEETRFIGLSKSP